MAEFRYYLQVLDQDELTAIQDELLDKYGGRIKVSERAKLTAGDGAANDYFGNSVSIDGDTMVVGAYADDDKGSKSGSAVRVHARHVRRPRLRLEEVAKLTAGDGAANDYFGYSVSIDGDTVVVGAYWDDDKDPTAGPRTCSRGPARRPSLQLDAGCQADRGRRRGEDRWLQRVDRRRHDGHRGVIGTTTRVPTAGRVRVHAHHGR